jgi:ribose 5-phosphate isomerase B
MEAKMKVAIASDHGGFELKEEIKKYLASEEIEIIDLGTNSEESVDYPIYGKLCADAVASGQVDGGIVCCGTGIGISIAANKVKGIRCALCTDTHMAEMTRKHNDSNMLALGGRTVSLEKTLEIVKTWLYTDFEGGRHKQRVDMLNEL